MVNTHFEYGSFQRHVAMPSTALRRTFTPPGDQTQQNLSPEIFTIDPDGDVVLILTRHIQFKDDDEGIDQPDDGTKEGSESSVSITKQRTHSEDNCGDKRKNEQLERESYTLTHPQLPDTPPMGNKSRDSPTCSEEVHIRVSSRHLTLASPVFSAMLHRKFNESNELRMTGSVDIDLPDEDPDSLLILLNILHGRLRQVPLVVELETLAEIAVLVDKYDVMEPLELLSNFWFENLRTTIPEGYTDEIPSWICVCWVFSKPVEFEHATRLAMRQGRDNLPFGGLPVPRSVIDEINGRRTEAVGKLVALLLEHLDNYLDKEHCSFECDALMLGSLTKRLRKLKIHPQPPNPPFTGLCFQDFNYRFRKGMYFPGAQRTSMLYDEHSKCAIRSIENLLVKCDRLLCGLSLEECRKPS